VFSDPLVATCPVSPVVSTQGAILAFRKPGSDPTVPGAINYMIWRGDTNTIYVLKRDNTLAQTFRVSAYKDTWKEGDPNIPAECAGITPPTDAAAANPTEALQVPIRGFGKVWCQEKLQDSIGFGIGKEVGAPAAIQETQGGLYLSINPSEGRKTETLFLFDLKNGIAYGR
jgi:hypothetical protein